MGPGQHLDRGLPASQTVRKPVSVVEATLSAAFCLGNPSRLISLPFSSLNLFCVFIICK